MQEHVALLSHEEQVHAHIHQAHHVPKVEIVHHEVAHHLTAPLVREERDVAVDEAADAIADQVAKEVMSISV